MSPANPFQKMRNSARIQSLENYRPIFKYLAAHFNSFRFPWRVQAGDSVRRIYNRIQEKRLRRHLRNNMPKAEVFLWVQLKGRKLLGQKFRRQYSVGPYVLDFYCPVLRLGIELDGDSHFQLGAQAYDQRRERYINKFGIRIVRFLNSEIYENMDGVLDALVRKIERCSGRGG